MKDKKKYCVGVACLALSGTVNSYAQIQTTFGNQSPSVGTNYGSINVKSFNIHRPSSLGLNSLEKKREALLVAENPTILKVTGIRFLHWFGDKEPYLGLQLANLSKLPALDVKVSMLNNSTAATLAKLRPHQFSKSYTLKILEGSLINVGSGGNIEIPIAPLSELKKTINQSCITSVGMDYDNTKLSLNSFDENSNSGFASVNRQGLYFKVSYKTIFQESVSYIIAMVVDSTDPNATLMMERGTGKMVPLKCIEYQPMHLTTLLQ